MAWAANEVGAQGVQGMQENAEAAAEFTMAESLEGLEFTTNTKNAGLWGQRAKEGVNNLAF